MQIIMNLKQNPFNKQRLQANTGVIFVVLQAYKRHTISDHIWAITFQITLNTNITECLKFRFHAIHILEPKQTVTVKLWCHSLHDILNCA